MQDKIKIFIVTLFMIIFMCNIVLAYTEKGRTRFISLDYINTLQKDSKWFADLRTKLKESLEKREGTGIYRIEISNTFLREIKSSVKNNKYIITNEMNRKLAEGF